jgi:hypothetical protein
MDYSGPELTLKDLEAGSPEVEEKLFELLRHKGFAILKVLETIESLLLNAILSSNLLQSLMRVSVDYSRLWRLKSMIFSAKRR